MKIELSYKVYQSCHHDFLPMWEPSTKDYSDMVHHHLGHRVCNQDIDLQHGTDYHFRGKQGYIQHPEIFMLMVKYFF